MLKIEIQFQTSDCQCYNDIYYCLKAINLVTHNYFLLREFFPSYLKNKFSFWEPEFWKEILSSKFYFSFKCYLASSWLTLGQFRGEKLY